MPRYIFSLSLLFAIAVNTTVVAAPITVPTGLNPGDQYRLAFVTSGTRDALSSDIADYNAFVQSHADAVPELLSLGVTWKAIGSTMFIDARDNTGTNPFVSTGVPIFRTDDVMVATSNADFWDGNLIAPISATEDGATVNDLVWTGSDFDGVEAAFSLGVGSSTQGLSSAATSDWIEWGLGNLGGTALPFYGVSEVLTVVPEPSSLILLSMAGVGVIVGYRSRPRRRNRTHSDHS